MEEFRQVEDQYLYFQARLEHDRNLTEEDRIAFNQHLRVLYNRLVRLWPEVESDIDNDSDTDSSDEILLPSSDEEDEDDFRRRQLQREQQIRNQAAIEEAARLRRQREDGRARFERCSRDNDINEQREKLFEKQRFERHFTDQLYDKQNRANECQAGLHPNVACSRRCAQLYAEFKRVYDMCKHPAAGII